MAHFLLDPTLQAVPNPRALARTWQRLAPLFRELPKRFSHLRAIGFITLGAMAPSAQAAYPTLLWCGHQWSVVTSGMAGGNTGSADNAFVDASGYLHLMITQVQGQWLCAEIFSTDLMGFGTYQWWVDARLDQLDPNVVFGLYPYGPEAGIGNSDWVIYPAQAGGTKTAAAYKVALTGSFTTSRFTWSSTGVEYWLMGGRQPLGTTANVMTTWTADPVNPLNNVPQQALPVGMNLWLYGGAAPSNGLPVEIIIYSFAKS